jgi:thymidylate synthase
MNKLDLDYQNLLKDILENGTQKETRNGGTISVFGRQIRHQMSEGFPLLTTKRMPFKTIVTELLWFLRGDTNIKYLVDNNCHIWDGDAYKNYISKQTKPKIGDYENYIDCYCGHTTTCDCGPLTQEEFINKIKNGGTFAKKWGELGPIYGKQWTSWGRKGKYVVNEDFNFSNGTFTEVDQIQNLINDLKTNPDSRRLMVNAWNVGELDQMVLPPCHYGFQVYTRELNLDERIDFHNKGSINKSSDYFHEHLDDMGVPKRAISLMWNQRSVDTFLGLPFNIASYGMLLSLLADEVNMIPEELIGNLGDTHLYSNHIDQSEEQISREPKPYLPKLKLSNVDILNGEFDYEILHYHSHPTIKAPLSN